MTLALPGLAPLALWDARLGPRPVAVYLQGHAAMAGALRAVLRLLGQPAEALATFPWESLRFEHVETIRSKLVASYKPATAAHHLLAVRGVLATAWKMGRISTDEYHRAIAVQPIKVETLPAGRMLDSAEVRVLLDVARAGGSAVGLRDAAIFAAALFGGLRRAEIASLDLASYRFGFGFPEVIGKGRKPREVPLAPPARAAVEEWIALLIHRAAARGEPLFPRANRGGKSLRRGSRISVSGVGEVIGAVVERAALALPATPHDLRRTFASTLLDLGADLAVVQRLMGHADPKTTSRYDRRPSEAGRAAADLLSKWRTP